MRAFAALLALLLPACGGKGGGGDGTSTALTATHQGTYSSTVPGDGWATAGSQWTLGPEGTALRARGDWNPPPSLVLSGRAVLSTNATFPAAPLSLSADLMLYFEPYDPPGPAVVLGVVDAQTGTTLATVVLDSGALTLAVSLGSAVSSPLPIVTGSSLQTKSGGSTEKAWHTVKLSIDGSGKATWQIDGNSVLSQAMPPSGNVRILLGCGTSTVFFNNVSLP